MSVEIQRLEHSDEDADAFLDTTFEDFSSRAIGEKRRHFCLLARDAGKIVAACKGYNYADDFHINQIAIAESHRTGGLGRRILAACEDLARERGCRTLRVDTYSYQAPGFYLKCGFEEYHRIRNYRGDHDRVFFRRSVLTPTN